MNIDISKIDKGKGDVEVINVKIPRDRVPKLIKEKGIYEAYHMSKKDWITIILNDTLEDEIIINLIGESYDLINSSK